MNIADMDLVEKPILFVREGDKTHPYSRGFTSNGLPFYVPPDEKNKNEHIQLQEYLFLPISNADFSENDEDYFWGFRFLFSSNQSTTYGMIQIPMAAITTLQLQYEIARVRYFPTGDKSITIDKLFDPLFPTQVINLQYPTVEIAQVSMNVIADTVCSYCSYYANKRV